MTDKRVLCLVGPSGSGKSTLAAKLVAEGGFAEAVSTTTRPMRDGEIDGVNYHFISVEEFERADQEGRFVETVSFNGNHYGVSAAEFDKIFAQGKRPVIVMEPNGARAVREFCHSRGWEPVIAFIDIPRELQFARVLERFAQDAKASSDVYARRLCAIVDEERGWIDAMPYDVVIPVSTPETTEEILSVLAEAKPLIGRPSRHRTPRLSRGEGAVFA